MTLQRLPVKKSSPYLLIALLLLVVVLMTLISHNRNRNSGQNAKPVDAAEHVSQSTEEMFYPVIVDTVPTSNP